MRDEYGTKQAWHSHLPAGPAGIYRRLGRGRRKEGGRGAPGPRLRYQKHGYEIRRKDLGAGGEENAAACTEQAAAKGPAERRGYRSGVLRGSAESVHRLLLYPTQHRYPPPGALRSLLHHGPEPSAGFHGGGRRVCRPGGGHDLQPLRGLRAAVPLSPGLRRSADPHRPVDRHRLRRGPGHHGKGPHRHRIRHYRHGDGPGHHRCRQHGPSHGPRRC